MSLKESMEIVVLSPHIDDFIIGVGAYIVKLSRSNIVNIVYMSDGINHEKDMTDMALRACKELGLSEQRIHFLGFKNTMFTTEIIKPAYKMIQNLEFKPFLILCPNNTDLNQDHCVTSRLAHILARPKPKTDPINLLAYETLSSTEWGFQPFQPNFFVEITGTLWKKKEDALVELLPKLREWPYPLSMNGILVKQQQRGMECGYNLAEAFQAIRWYG